MKKKLTPILVGAALLIAARLLAEAAFWPSLALYIAAYLVVGREVVFKAARNICRGEVFDENFLMVVATVGAFAVRQFPEAVAVMLFYQVGEMFQDYAVDKSRRSISTLMDIRPDHATLLHDDGSAEEVDPSTVHVGDLILVNAGEKIPLDGVVESGTALLDTAALTGESVPREVTVGSEALSGCIDLNGALTVRVEKTFGASTVSKILDLVENASARKSRSENFISRFAAVYTPIVVIAAVLLALIPPLLLHQPFGDWIYRACTFLVVSCPCALVISVPLSFFGGIGGASKAGILVKGGNYLEALASAEIAVFDKTGTLTKGTFEVREVQPVGMNADALLALAATAESRSDHPIAKSLLDACKSPDTASLADVQEIAGHGVKATIGGKTVLVGNRRLMSEIGITPPAADAVGTMVYVAVDGVFAGSICIADAVKEDAADAIKGLKAAHVRRTVMLTGDVRPVGEAVGRELGLDEVYTDLLPAGKVEKLESLLKETSPTGKLLFVGDGINDAPVLARADVGVAMGGLGADAAIEAADVVIMDDKPSRIASAIAIARKTLRIVRQNIVFALTVKILVLVLSALGIANMWAAVFADVGVSVLAILNALRMLQKQKD